MSAPDQPAAPTEKRQSIRIVLEGAILASIVWIGSSMQQQIVSIAKLQEQMSQVSATLANVPSLTERVTKTEMQIVELQRRQELDDKHREQTAAQQQNVQSNLKGWTR
jgi:K+/H+ antiporter YhaU regulatory subunit KhtT